MNPNEALLLWEKAEAQSKIQKNITPIYTDISDCEYNELPFVRNTELSYLERSFLHWEAFKKGAVKQTEPMVKGIMFHSAVLEPNTFYDGFAVKEDGRTKVGKEANANAIEAGKMLVSEKDLEAIIGIMGSALSNPFISTLFRRATHIEQPFLFQYGAHGFKIRPDMVTTISEPSDTIIDLKFVQDANPETFIYKAQKMGYDRQLSLYQIGAKAHGLPAKNCYIIAIEKEPPYAFSIIKLSDDVLSNGRTKLDTLLTKYDKAIQMKSTNQRFTSYNDESVFEWEAEY